MSDGEIDAGGPGGSEPQRRLSGGGADTAKGRSVERGDGGLRGSAGTKTGTSAGGRTPAMRELAGARRIASAARSAREDDGAGAILSVGNETGRAATARCRG